MMHTKPEKNKIYTSCIILFLLFAHLCHGATDDGAVNHKMMFQKNVLIFKQALKVYSEILSESNQGNLVDNQIRDELLQYIKNLEKWVDISFDDPSSEAAKNEAITSNAGALKRAEQKSLHISQLAEMTSCVYGFNAKLKSDSTLLDKLKILSVQVEDFQKD